MASSFDGLSRTERIDEFCRLLQFPEVQAALEYIIASSLVNHNIFMRLNLIEEYLGADEKHCIGRDLDYNEDDPECEEERTPLPNLQEQLKSITKEVPKLEVNTLTDIRIKRLIEHLERINPRPNQSGIRYMTSTEVGKYLQNEIEEEYRYNGNARVVRNDLIKQAVKKYPNKVKASKSKNGNKSLRIELIQE